MTCGEPTPKQAILTGVHTHTGVTVLPERLAHVHLPIVTGRSCNTRKRGLEKLITRLQYFSATNEVSMVRRHVRLTTSFETANGLYKAGEYR